MSDNLQSIVQRLVPLLAQLDLLKASLSAAKQVMHILAAAIFSCMVLVQTSLLCL